MWIINPGLLLVFICVCLPSVFATNKAKLSKTPLPKENFILERVSQFYILFDPFPNKPWFLRVRSKNLLQTLWEMENWLLTSLFPTVFSTRLDNFLPFSSNLKLSSANSFSLDECKICLLGKG